jgi:hypothetical protein
VSRSLRRGALAAALVLSLAPLAACAAGADSQTLQVQPDVVSTSVGDIKIQNALIITEPNGTGPASISARVFNNGSSAQQLSGIIVQGSAQQATVTGADGKAGPLAIPAGGSIALGGQGNPSAIIPNAQGLRQGAFESVAFSLSSAGEVTVSPAVVSATHYFSGYGPSVTAVPSGAPTAARSASASASAHPSAKGASSAKG